MPHDAATDPAPESLLYTCQVHSPDGRMLSTLALVSDPCDSTYEVQNPVSLHWVLVPSSTVVLGRRLDIVPPPGQRASLRAWEWNPGDGWTYHPAPATMPMTRTQHLQRASLRACEAYPAESDRIARGYGIAVEDGVTLLANGTAIVGSQSHPGETYRVEGGQCTCRDAARAPAGRCKHRWAVALTKTVRAHQETL